MSTENVPRDKVRPKPPLAQTRRQGRSRNKQGMLGLERRRQWHIGPQVRLVPVEVVQDIEETSMGLINGLGHSLSGTSLELDKDIVHCRE